MSPAEPSNRVEYRMERTYEVSASPEQVWDAIATTDGIATWMAPTELEPRVGGRVAFDLGGFVSVGVVTGYDTNERFAYEEPWPVEDHMPTAEVDMSLVSPIATEFLVESASGGSCVVRVVSSSYGSGADWEHEFFAEMIEGWIEMLDGLAARLDGVGAATPAG